MDDKTSTTAPPPPAARPRLKVFLCHASFDKAQVRELYRRLKAEDLEPWLDEEDLIGGQSWELEITRAVKASHVVIVCLSQRATTEAGFRHKEIKFALDKADEQPEGTISIVPIRLEECQIPERLHALHTLNYYDERGYDRLLIALRKRADDLKITFGKSHAELQRAEERQEETAVQSQGQPAIPRAEMRKMLIERYDLEGLRELCFDLDIDYTTLSGDAPNTLARDLIAKLISKRRLGELEQLLQQILATEAAAKAEAERLVREQAIREEAERRKRALEKAEVERLAKEQAMRKEAERRRKRDEAQFRADLESDDPTRFQPAVTRLLDWRLQNLRVINSKPVVDLEFITCAEYQLFLDAKREEKKYYQPDHWKTFHFPSGQALEPVSGVRGLDAEAFCKWLTEQQGGQTAYRLPSLKGHQFPSRIQVLATLCMDNVGRFSLVDPSDQMKRKIEKSLPTTILPFSSLNLDLTLDPILNLDLAHNRDFAHNLASNGDFAYNLASNRARALDRALDRTLDRAFDRARVLTRAHNLGSGFAKVTETIERDNSKEALQLTIALHRSADEFVHRRATLLLKLLEAASALDFLQWRRAYREFVLYSAEYVYIDYTQQEQSDNKDYSTEKQIMADLYWWARIVMAREEGKLPAWEGIRIVAEER